MQDPGFLFMLGIEGSRATRAHARLLRDTGACGVLLLARNIEDARQTARLTRDLVQGVGRPLLFSVDHEGGWVLRFKSGVTAFPGNAALGRAGSPERAYAVGKAMARELAALGIQINLAPVLDVARAYNPGIGIRSFGGDPRLVSRLGAAMIRGMQEHGVWACAKHFPGKGAATVDAHVELPTIRLPKAEFERVHLAPFRAAVKAGAACVMTSHVLFPGLDRRAPATFSRSITGDLLRRKLGFEGVVISDDLCMGAIARRWPIQEAASKSLAAGHDILLIAHQETVQRESVELVRASGLPDGEVAAAARRIGRLFSPAKARAPNPKAHEALSRGVAKDAVTVASRGPLPLPLKPGRGPLLVLFPDFSEVRTRFTFEGGPRGPEKALRRRLASWGPHRWRRTRVESPGDPNLAAAIDAAPRILFFCFEARRFAGQREALELVRTRAADRAVACLIRGSWDGDWLEGVTTVDAGGYRLHSLEAAAERILCSPRS